MFQAQSRYKRIITILNAVYDVSEVGSYPAYTSGRKRSLAFNDVSGKLVPVTADSMLRNALLACTK